MTENTARVIAVKLGNVKTGQLKLSPDFLDLKDGVWFCLQLCYKKKSPPKMGTSVPRPAFQRHFSTRVSWHSQFSGLPCKSSSSSDLIFLTLYCSFYQSKSGKSLLPLGKPSPKEQDRDLVTVEEETIMPRLGIVLE